MSKQKTKVDLQNEIEDLKKTINNRDAQINQIEIEYSNSRHRFNELHENLANALRPIEYHITSGNNIFGGTVNRERLENQSTTVIFFRIGRLIAIEEEYKQLKDRFLPLEKSQVLEMEMNQNNRRV